MERIRPKCYSGRFLCVDGLKHDWFLPICKTIFHSLRVYFHEQKIKKNLVKKLIEKPTIVAESLVPKLVWIGHSTFLIQIGGKNILTDPIFGSLSLIFRRLVPAAISVVDLPRIDYILISHNHFDHMDRASLLELHKRFPQVKVLAPMGDKKWFDKHGFSDAVECIWWESHQDAIFKELKFTFLPANHWSQRTLFDKNCSLWGSWMIQYQDVKIYFAGDTSWGDHFEQIGREFGSIDVACMPIGPGEPREWMKETHINAEEAVRAFILLNAKMFVPMHWGTFHLGFDELYEPIRLLQKTWKELHRSLKHKKLSIIKFGETIVVPYLYGSYQQDSSILVK